MHDEHAVSGAGAALADVIRQDEVGGAGLVPLGADGQESRRLVDHQDVSVLVEYHEAVRQETWTGASIHGDFQAIGNSRHQLTHLCNGTVAVYTLDQGVATSRQS